MFKRIVSFILLSVMLISPSVTTTSYAESSFSDVKSSDWFAPYVEQAKENNIIGGYPDGTFRPQGTVTYAEFLVMAMQGERSDKPSASTHWGAPYYTYAIEHRIFTADQISIDDLNKSIPRKDMAIIMAGVLKDNNLGIKEPYPWAAILYKDIHRYSDWESFDRQIALCSFYGCLSGYEDKTFRPYGNLTRAEAAAAMVALLKAVDESKDMTLYADTPLPRPTNRTTLMNYMENYRPGVDYRFNGEMSKSVSDDVRQGPYFWADPTLMHAERFADPTILKWSQDVLNNVRFTLKNNQVCVVYELPKKISTIKSYEMFVNVDNDNPSSGTYLITPFWESKETLPSGAPISDIQFPYLKKISVSLVVYYNQADESIVVDGNAYHKGETLRLTYLFDCASQVASLRCQASGSLPYKHEGGFVVNREYIANSTCYDVSDEVFAKLLNQ